MLQKTLTGPEILEMVKKQLKHDGLEVIKTLGDGIGLSSNTIRFEVKMVDKPVNNLLNKPPGYRGLHTAQGSGVTVTKGKDSTSWTSQGDPRSKAHFGNRGDITLCGPHITFHKVADVDDEEIKIGGTV